MKSRDKKLFELSNAQKTITNKIDLAPFKKLWKEVAVILYPIIVESNKNEGFIEACRNKALQHFKFNIHKLSAVLPAIDDNVNRIYQEFTIILNETILNIFKLDIILDELAENPKIDCIDKALIRERFFLFFLISTFRKRMKEIKIPEIWIDGSQIWGLYQAIKKRHELTVQDTNTREKFNFSSFLQEVVIYQIELLFAKMREQNSVLDENDINSISTLDITKLLQYPIENFCMQGIVNDIKLNDINSLEGKLILLQTLFFYTHGIESQSDFLHRKRDIPSSTATYTREYRQYLRNEFKKLNLI
ncbi:MAG: hypothetical protein U0Y10_02035 [Spirosomataceae bacterium]